MIQYGFVEDKPQRVLDIFVGRMCNSSSQDVFTKKTYNRTKAVDNLEQAAAAGEDTEAALKMIKPAQLDNFDNP